MQFPSQTTKVCLRCKATAPIDAPLCEECGQVYPSQSSEMAPIVAYVPSEKPSRRGSYIVAGVVLTLVVVTSGIAYLKWTEDEHTPQAVSTQNSQPKSAPSPAHSNTPPGTEASSARRNPQFYRP